jgi:hypothetical protein
VLSTALPTGHPAEAALKLLENLALFCQNLLVKSRAKANQNNDGSHDNSPHSDGAVAFVGGRAIL